MMAVDNVGSQTESSSITENSPIKVLAASYSPLIRKGIISMLSDVTDILVVGHASCRVEIIEGINLYSPDVLIIDSINGSEKDIPETLKLVNKSYKDVKPLLIVDKHDDSIELIALEMGVRGILYEHSDKTDYIKCIRSLNSNKLWIRQNILEKFIIDSLPRLEFKRESLQNDFFSSLTRRELEVIQLVVYGHKNKEIGHKLFVSEKTVKNHLSRIFKKLNVKRRVELKKYLRR